MADFGGMFDASGIAPREEIKALTPGEYPAVIEASEWKISNSGKGRYLELTIQVIDGPSKGRKIWDRLNLDYNNPADPERTRQTIEIARGTLSAICHAVQKLQVRDSSDLHNIPLTIVVKAGKDDRGNITAEVKAYKPAGGKVSAGAVGGASGGSDGKLPWER